MVNVQFKKILLAAVFLPCSFTSEVVNQSLTWQSVQRQLLSCKTEYNKFASQKSIEDKEFFNLQQQLAAVYLAQKRYRLGFGTAFLPSEKSLCNYIHKKTFLNLKIKELLPLYKQKALEYKQRYTTSDFDRIQKDLKKFEALNLLHIKLFEQYCGATKKSLLTPLDFKEIKTIEDGLKSSPFTPGKKPTDLVDWITPVAGKEDKQNPQKWLPLEGAVVLAPDSGVVSGIYNFENDLIIFIKKHHFTYAIKGLSKCCVKANDKLMQGEPIGVCHSENPSAIELQLWKNEIILNPSPYHKETNL